MLGPVQPHPDAEAVSTYCIMSTICTRPAKRYAMVHGRRVHGCRDRDVNRNLSSFDGRRAPAARAEFFLTFGGDFVAGTWRDTNMFSAGPCPTRYLKIRSK